MFVSDINCFDWLPEDLKSEFIFSTSNVFEDSKKDILLAINSFSENNFNDLKAKLY